MKTRNLLIISALIFVVFTSLQLEKCFIGDYLIGKARQWLPPKVGINLIFLAPDGSQFQVASLVKDTIQTFTNEDCDGTYRGESADQILFLNTVRSDSFHISLGMNGSVCALAVTSGTLYLSTCRSSIDEATSLAMILARNFQLEGKIYSDVRIFPANSSTDLSTDSVIVAKNDGLAGFKYQGKMFSRQ